MWLTDRAFRDVLAATPLISIDLIVQAPAGKIFLGQRLNRPAQGFWFVPGGRIRKNETLDAAFSRLCIAELGVAFERNQACLLGVYEHFYNDSMYGDGTIDPSTHYVVLGYHLSLHKEIELNPSMEQHRRYRWWPLEEMQNNIEVHANTRAYL